MKWHLGEVSTAFKVIKLTVIIISPFIHLFSEQVFDIARAVELDHDCSILLREMRRHPGLPHVPSNAVDPVNGTIIARAVHDVFSFLLPRFKMIIHFLRASILKSQGKDALLQFPHFVLLCTHLV